MTALIVFSHLRWDFVFQRPQHLLSRLARDHRVVYVEEPVHDTGGARLERLHPGSGITVLRPHTPLQAVGFDDAQLRVIQPLLERFVDEEAIDDPLVWFYTPMALPLMHALNPRAVIYDCIDELALSINAPPQMRERESQLLRSADLVLASGPSLWQAKRLLHANVHCLPSSVDAAHFAPERITANCEEYLAAERIQSSIPAPRLGFFGVIDERVDLGLLAALAQARSDWQLVIVGPVVRNDSALPCGGNIHWLGQQPYSRLPALVAAWDVCLLPYAVNAHTRFVSPTKTLEYLAAEKPVISTAVDDVIGMYGDVVRIARNRDDFIAACEAMLTETPQRRAQRLVDSAACVSRFSWDESAQTVRRLIDQVLQDRPREPVIRRGGVYAPRQAASSSADTSSPCAAPR